MKKLGFGQLGSSREYLRGQRLGDAKFQWANRRYWPHEPPRELGREGNRRCFGDRIQWIRARNRVVLRVQKNEEKMVRTKENTTSTHQQKTRYAPVKRKIESEVNRTAVPTSPRSL